jgi:S-adenosylmethionine/arginine decarboxylase-like enzyme
MKPLDTPKIYYLDTPSWNKGLTGIVPIQTSHIAFHFWSTPDKNIFHNSNSRCLLQLDIYTCGALPHDVVPILLREVEEFEPTHLDCTVFNRKYKLLKELEVHWDAQEENWESWIGSFSDRKS